MAPVFISRVTLLAGLVATVVTGICAMLALPGSAGESSAARWCRPPPSIFRATPHPCHVALQGVVARPEPAGGARAPARAEQGRRRGALRSRRSRRGGNRRGGAPRCVRRRRRLRRAQRRGSRRPRSTSPNDFPSSEDPAVLIVQRPGTITTQLDGMQESHHRRAGRDRRPQVAPCSFAKRVRDGAPCGAPALLRLPRGRHGRRGRGDCGGRRVPCGAGPTASRRAQEAFRFVQEAVLALQYLGCTVGSAEAS